MSSAQVSGLSNSEKKSAYSLASIYAMRMLGLFMILPVFSVYAQQLEHSTPTLIGVAIGAYGLTQAFLQIPFGYFSDRFGRKPMIVFGMILFALGSIIAGSSDSIYGVIAGRLLQGSGAVAAVLMAFAADLTREENRLKVMAIIGMSIGFSFAIAMVFGSILDQWIGVQGIFYLTALLAMGAIFIVIFVVPDVPTARHRDTQAEPEKLIQSLLDTELLRCVIGIFILHMVLTATFVVLPLSLVDPNQLLLPLHEHWKLYLPTMILAMGLMVPFVIIAETKRKMRVVFISAIAVLCLSELAFFYLKQNIWEIGIVLLIFFTAFNLLEATLPSLVAKLSPSEKKGTAMGVYSTSQFLGAFFGGLIGGKLMGWFDKDSIYLFACVSLLVWFFIALLMKNPRYLSNFVVKVDNIKSVDVLHLTQLLTEVNGVAEAMVIVEDGKAFLKVDLHALDKEKLLEISRRFSKDMEL